MTHYQKHTVVAQPTIQLWRSEWG